MNDIEKAIESMQLQKMQIGIDYSDRKDMTVICLTEQQAEEILMAAERQIPKIITRANIEDDYLCPTCGEPRWWKDGNHCKDCGQKLIWVP